MTFSKLQPLRPLIPLALVPSLLPAANTVTDDFDAYPGSGSDYGWTQGWQSPTISNNGSSTIENTDPLNGGGNYISQVTSQSPAAGAGNRSMTRQLDSSVIDTTRPYTISWDFRIDNFSSVNDPGTYGGNVGFDKFNDRIHFGANTGGNNGSDASASWLIGAVGDRNGGNWYVYNNTSGTDGPNFDSAYTTNTGLSFNLGDVYHFEVNVDPASTSYTATITNLDTSDSYTTPTAFTFRNTTPEAHQHLLFGSHVEQDEYREFSLDNLTIVGVPEPSGTTLFGLALSLGLLKRRR
ncbi:MAG: PEP-CTERM sorting domain-containing protein [Verrucomicrobiales bacterium]